MVGSVNETYKIWPHDPAQEYVCKEGGDICLPGTTCSDLTSHGIVWDTAEADIEAFNYYYTNFDNIWESMLTIF
jgi:hypothetical protein